MVDVVYEMCYAEDYGFGATLVRLVMIFLIGVVVPVVDMLCSVAFGKCFLI